MLRHSLPLVLIAVLVLTGIAPTLAAAERDADQAIRQATGLRLSVAESWIRRNIISTRTPYGFKIKSVDADSSAERAGLKAGDVLLKWDGKPIKSRRDFSAWIDGAERGKPVPIVYARLKADRTLATRRPWQEHQGALTLEP